jgi:outer membrane cobalamin receptor
MVRIVFSILICFIVVIPLLAEGSMIQLKEVVVSATRYEEEVSSVPAHVTVITEDDIQNSTALNIPDLLRTEAGIHVNDFW